MNRDTGTNTQWYKYDQLCMYRIVQTLWVHLHRHTWRHGEVQKCRRDETRIWNCNDFGCFGFLIPNSWTTFKVAKVVGSGTVCWTRLRPDTFSDTGISLNNAALLTVPNQAASGETYLCTATGCQLLWDSCEFQCCGPGIFQGQQGPKILVV